MILIVKYICTERPEYPAIYLLDVYNSVKPLGWGKSVNRVELDGLVIKEQMSCIFSHRQLILLKSALQKTPWIIPALLTTTHCFSLLEFVLFAYLYLLSQMVCVIITVGN